MAVLVGKLNVPNYTFLSSEISSSKVPGISIVGAVCLATDTGNWYIVKEDLTLQSYSLPVSISAETIQIGVVGVTGTVNVAGIVGITGTTTVSGNVGITGISSIQGYEGGVPQAVVGLGSPISITWTGATGTTAYTAKDNVGTLVVPTGATGVGAAPIVVTTGAILHGLSDGDTVGIAGVTGMSNMNGTNYAKVSTYSTTTFALYSDKILATPVTANGTFAGTSPTIARLFRLSNLFRVNNGSGYITKIRLMTDNAAWTDQFKIHFYNSSSITPLNDNAVFTLLYTNASSRLGACTMPAFATEGTGSTAAYSNAVPGDGVSGLPLFVHNNDGTRDLYFRVEDLSAGTPVSNQNYYIEITLDEN